MEQQNDNAPECELTTDDDSDKWNPYDYYDCRSETNTPKRTQQYIDETMPPGVKEAIAKRQAELKARAVAVPLQNAEPAKLR